MKISISRNWCHKVIISYIRARNHPMKLRIINWLKAFLGLDEILAHTNSGYHMYLNSTDCVQYQILHQGVYEAGTLNLIKTLLKEASCFVDVGGHVGQYSLAASRILEPFGKVIVIEPNPKTFTSLLKNIEINHFKNIYPVLGAVSNFNKNIKMQIPPDGNWGMSREYTCSSHYEGLVYNTYAFKLSDLIQSFNIEKIDVVKIDVEGHELQVLEGLFDCDKFYPKHIIFESIPEHFEGAYEVIKYLVLRGYKLYNIFGYPYDEISALPECNLWARKD